MCCGELLKKEIFASPVKIHCLFASWALSGPNLLVKFLLFSYKKFFQPAKRTWPFWIYARNNFRRFQSALCFSKKTFLPQINSNCLKQIQKGLAIQFLLFKVFEISLRRWTKQY